MAFSLSDALPLLRCPVSGAALQLQGDSLVAPTGQRYPVREGIADLTIQAPHSPATASEYDAIAGLAYNALLFNPFTMAFMWGLGVLQAPRLLRPGRELGTGTVLDVACGTGVFTARAYRQNSETRILAVDYSFGMLRATKARTARLGVNNAVFVRADVAKLPLADSCLDRCLSMASFHAFPDPAAAAAEIGRVLKPGAKLAVSVACSGERRISDAIIEHVMKPRGYFRQGLPAATYRGFLERGGFANVETRMAGAVAILRGVKGLAAPSRPDERG